MWGNTAMVNVEKYLSAQISIWKVWLITADSRWQEGSRVHTDYTKVNKTLYTIAKQVWYLHTKQIHNICWATGRRQSNNNKKGHSFPINK